MWKCKLFRNSEKKRIKSEDLTTRYQNYKATVHKTAKYRCYGKYIDQRTKWRPEINPHV